MRRSWVWLVIGGLILLSVGSAAAQSGTARVRLIHAAPDTPPMDVLLDGQVVQQNVAYATIGDYLDVPAGSHTVAAAPAGQGADAAVISQQISVDAGASYTVAVVGLENISAKQFTDDLAAPAAGQARVRVLHFSPDAPGADVEVIDGPTLAQNIAFGAASPYLDVAAGSYNLRLVANGNNTVIVQLPNTSFEAGQIYDVAAVGRLADLRVISASTAPVAAAAEQTAQAPPAAMPAAGAEDHGAALLALGLALLFAGLGLRWRTRDLA